MPMDIHAQHADLLNELIKSVAESHDIASEEFTLAVTNVDKFSNIQLPELPSEPTPTPTTRWGKFKAGAAAALDNETTRTLIKAGGAFAGVGLVVYSTIHRDHAIDRAALQQANQRQI